ncbi:GM14347 [Drosophila sechellia]|uniref:GM14347 n=1 Tax=Drosophila sechellia TaxID=7238 RepID=B4HXQ5_DROSE|nr:GM14347 [Drosophila sechellia]
MRSMEATYPSLQCGCDSDFEYAAHSMPYKSMAGRDTSCGICNCQEIRGTEEDQEALKEHAEEQEDQARQSASGASNCLQIIMHYFITPASNLFELSQPLLDPNPDPVFNRRLNPNPNPIRHPTPGNGQQSNHLPPQADL